MVDVEGSRMTRRNAFAAQVGVAFYDTDSVEAVTLLSYEDFKRNQEVIPVAKGWWWLKTPGAYRKNAMYVFLDGEAYTDGYEVNSETAGVRPVLRLKPEFAEGLSYGEKVIIGNYDATVLDDNTCLIDDVVCTRRFDAASGKWDDSELKQYIESDAFMKIVFDEQC